MWFLGPPLPPPKKKVQRCKFSWRLALKNSSYSIFIRYRNFKMTYFWKKALKLPKCQMQNRRNRLVLGEKILLTFVSYKWEHLSNIRSKSESIGDMAVSRWSGITLKAANRANPIPGFLELFFVFFKIALKSDLLILMSSWIVFL